jgi:alanine racemase
MPTCWVEIDLAAIRSNYRAVAALVGEGVELLCVVKANAYGHGAVEVTRALAAEGAPYVAVTRVEEAVPLREAGILTPILLLAPAPREDLVSVVEHDLTACISQREDAEWLSAEAVRQNKTARAQLNVNTGMGRLGVEPPEAVALAALVQEQPNVELEAAFTHFANAAGPVGESGAVQAQFAQFQSLIAPIARAADIDEKRFHCANSAALLRFPAMRLSRVRPGTILYGQYPSPACAAAGQTAGLALREAFAVKARVIALKELQAGQRVGYGGEWQAKQPARIATIAVGYADGLSMEPHARPETPRAILTRAARQALKARPGKGRTVQVRGQAAPIIGRIAMQQCSIDVTHLPEVALGDEVTVPMRRLAAGAHLPRVTVAA